MEQRVSFQPAPPARCTRLHRIERQPVRHRWEQRSLAAVKDNDVAAEHLFDAIWISLDNVPATEDQLVIVNTLLAT
jgi:hypothetical protein